MKEILIKRDPKQNRTLTGVVRIRPEAEMIVQMFCIKEDMSASEVVSKIICAAAPYIKFDDTEEET